MEKVFTFLTLGEKTVHVRLEECNVGSFHYHSLYPMFLCFFNAGMPLWLVKKDKMWLAPPSIRLPYFAHTPYRYHVWTLIRILSLTLVGTLG